MLNSLSAAISLTAIIISLLVTTPEGKIVYDFIQEHSTLYMKITLALGMILTVIFVALVRHKSEPLPPDCYVENIFINRLPPDEIVELHILLTEQEEGWTLVGNKLSIGNFIFLTYENIPIFFFKGEKIHIHPDLEPELARAYHLRIKKIKNKISEAENERWKIDFNKRQEVLKKTKQDIIKELESMVS